MCGILGFIPPDPPRLELCLQSLSHRGPDGEGVWSNEYITLGHRRLSIIDLSDGGKQPMRFENLVIVFNGEIYNYIEVKKELISAGYSFSTSSDTEVLLKAYHCWNTKAFDKLNGMWALAIYDLNNKLLLLCRDRFGVKPLYYFHKDNRFVFASEIQTIHKALGPQHPLDESVLGAIVKGDSQWHGGERTYLEGVKILPAGSILNLNDKNLKINLWYKLKRVDVPVVLEEQALMLKDLLREACVLRLRSDVPVGTCLSGGLDSGSISATIEKLSQGLLQNFTHRSFCAAFPGSPIDESSKAVRLSNQLKLRLDIVNMVDPSPDDLEQALKACDGPMHALAFYPIWKLYKHIRQQGILVTLDGQGPDEMMGGYRPMDAGIRAALKERDLPWMLDIYKTYSSQGETAQVSAKKISRKILISTFSEEIKKRMKGPNGKDRGQKKLHPFSDNLLDEELYQEFFYSPLPPILQQYDRCSMAHGVECRMPFMDYRLVEFVFSLPAKSKVGGGYTKRVLREAMKDLLPEETRLDKQKIGFNAPIVNWFRGPLKSWMLDIMNSEVYRNSPYFEGMKMKDTFERFQKYDNPQWDDAWPFWGGVHYAWWKQNFR